MKYGAGLLCEGSSVDLILCLLQISSAAASSPAINVSADALFGLALSFLAFTAVKGKIWILKRLRTLIISHFTEELAWHLLLGSFSVKYGLSLTSIHSRGIARNCNFFYLLHLHCKFEKVCALTRSMLLFLMCWAFKKNHISFGIHLSFICPNNDQWKESYVWFTDYIPNKNYKAETNRKQINKTTTVIKFDPWAALPIIHCCAPGFVFMAPVDFYARSYLLKSFFFYFPPHCSDSSRLFFQRNLSHVLAPISSFLCLVWWLFLTLSALTQPCANTFVSLLV